MWLGLLAPFIFTTAKSVGDVQAGVGALDAVRGGGPLLMWLLARRVQPDLPLPVRRSAIAVGAATFLAVAVASTVWSVDPRGTALKCVPLVFTFVCLARLSRSYPDFETLLRALFHVVHLILVGLLVQLLVVPSLAYSGSVSDPIPRVHSVVPSIASNLLGLVLAAGLISLLLDVGPRWTRQLPVRLVLVVAYLLMLVGTRSRTVTVIAVIAVAVGALVAMHRSQLAAMCGWLGFGVGLCVVEVVMSQPRIMLGLEEFALRGQDRNALTSLTGRTEIWERALLAWQDQPLLGFGYYVGHRVELARRYERLSLYSNIDSTWIETLVNVGVLGATGLATFAVAGLVAVARLRDQPGRVHVAAGLVAASCMAMSPMNPGIQSPTPTLILFGVVAFGAALQSRATLPEATSIRRCERSDARVRSRPCDRPDTEVANTAQR